MEEEVEEEVAFRNRVGIRDLTLALTGVVSGMPRTWHIYLLTWREKVTKPTMIFWDVGRFPVLIFMQRKFKVTHLLLHLCLELQWTRMLQNTLTLLSAHVSNR